MQRWKLSALAAATLALSSLPAHDAWAVALGRITLQSALGEPLRAEVEISQLSTAEADSLQAAIASPAAFREQGMEYTGTANSVRVQVQKRANGTAVLRLSSFQPVNDPFVDLVIDASWASGKLQRNYTLLLDLPTSRRPAPAPTSVPQAAPEAMTAPARPTAATTLPASSPVSTAGRSLRNDRDRDEAALPAQRRRQNKTATAAASPLGEVRVKAGDTAGRIAAAHKPVGVSLDQMLVAMLRSNPQAFVNGNVNRMRSGVVLQLPDQAAAQATSASQARQIMAVQAQDFNQFRRQLAGLAPMAAVEAASRSASGQVQTQVADAKAASAAPDKLTLSKASLKETAADEQLARQKQAAEQAARADELQRNVAELNQIAAATQAAGTASAAAANSDSSAAPSTLPSINLPVTSTVTAAPPAEGAAAAAQSEPAAPAAAPAAAAKPVAATPPMPEEPSFIDSLMEDPGIPLAGAALLALLLGYGGYRVSQRRKAAADSTLRDSRLAADSFFGGSGGQRVDTTTGSSPMSGQSIQYSPSQLDAGDVDPLAEADVYLAYGRDLQAEEILKEALRSDPNRLVLHQKLAEIYAKRHDRMAFAAVANKVFALTQGQGPEWQRLAGQGRILDPKNALYQPAGAASSVAQAAPTSPASALIGGAGATTAFDTALAAAQEADREGIPTEPSSLDFSLDLELPGGLADAAAAPKPIPPEPISEPDEQDFAALAQWDAPAAQAAPAEDKGLSLDLEDLASFSLPTSTSATPASTPAAIEQESLNALEFDLDSLMLPVSPASQTGADSETPADTATADSSLNLSATEQESRTELMTLELPTDVRRTADSSSPAPAEAAFDLSGLSLDLGVPNPVDDFAAVASPSEPEDPLATKLDLAQEFAAIGDSDGARTLIEEVIAEAQGDLKVKAQSLLSQIG